MSRTTRKTLTDKNYREARRGRVNSQAAWDATLRGPYRVRNAGRGPLLMSRSNLPNYWWDDELERGKHSRPREKRMLKRRQRSAAMREATDSVE